VRVASKANSALSCGDEPRFGVRVVTKRFVLWLSLCLGVRYFGSAQRVEKKSIGKLLLTREVD